MINVAAGALFTNEVGEILLVKPTYRDGWHIPGGAAEPNESPRESCEREVKEELGFDRRVGNLLCVDWVRGANRIVFFFDGGELTEREASAISLPPAELSDWRFVPVEHVTELVPAPIGPRIVVAAALGTANHCGVYLENGHRP